MKDIAGKNVWVIGASTGIGAALVSELARQGANVALSARRENLLQNQMVKLSKGHHLCAPLDVANIQSIKAAQSDIVKNWGQIDSVIFMAAIYSAHDGQAKDIGFIQDMIAINLGGAFNVLDGVIPYFKAQGQGQIVLCASVAGYRGLPHGQPYCATKAALLSLSESLKIELEPHNIDVKVIAPGFVQSPLTDKNDFEMPMIIPAEKAARHICKGLISRSFEIHFPKRFTYMMKFLKIAPYPVFFPLMRRVLRRLGASFHL